MSFSRRPICFLALFVLFSFFELSAQNPNCEADTSPPTAQCPPSPTAPIECPAGFNANPAAPNTPQDDSIDPFVVRVLYEEYFDDEQQHDAGVTGYGDGTGPNDGCINILDDCWNRLDRNDGTWIITTGDDPPNFNLENTGDYVEVSDSSWLEAADLDTVLCFETLPIDIRDMTSVTFSLKMLDISVGSGLEGSDGFDVSYSADGGASFSLPIASKRGPFDPQLIVQDGIVGDSLIIRVCFYSTGGGDKLALDDIVVTGTISPANVQDNSDPAPIVSYQDVLEFPGDCDLPGQAAWRVNRTWTIADHCGNATECVQVFEFIDTASPTFDCPLSPGELMEGPPDFNTSPVASNTPQDPRIDPTITSFPENIRDNSDPAPAVDYQDVFELLEPGDIPGQIYWRVTRVWTITDHCGNFKECRQFFDFYGSIPPSVDCPPQPFDSIECSADFNLSPVPPNTSQHSCIAPSIVGAPTNVRSNCIITLYEERFNEEGAGLFGDCVSPGLPTTNCNYTAPSNGQWTVSGSSYSLSGGIHADSLATVDGKLLAKDIDGTLCFETSSIDISNASSASFTLDLSQEGDFEEDDSIEVSYSLDGGDFVRVASFSGHIGGDSKMVFESGLNGSTLVLKVCFSNNANDELYRLDNVVVLGEITAAAAINYQDVLEFSSPCQEAEPGSWRLTRTWTITDYCGSSRECIQVFDLLTNTACPLLLSPVVYLQGAYDASSGLMADNLHINHILPLTEPYETLGYSRLGRTGEYTRQEVFDVSGRDAIVDWVFIELHDKSDISLLRATRSALLQRDGDVVDVDGVSPVVFLNLPEDDYYVTVKHRNHLGVMSSSPVSLSSAINLVDFTSNLENAYGGINGIASLSDGLLGLYSGDLDHNGQIQNTDYNETITAVGASGYEPGDFDLNGQVQNTDLQLKLTPNIGRGQPFGQ